MIVTQNGYKNAEIDLDTGFTLSIESSAEDEQIHLYFNETFIATIDTTYMFSDTEGPDLQLSTFDNSLKRMICRVAWPDITRSKDKPFVSFARNAYFAKGTDDMRKMEEGVRIFYSKRD